MAQALQATINQKHFDKLPHNVGDRKNVAHLSSLARKVYDFLSAHRNFKTHDNQTYPYSDEFMGLHLSRSPNTIRGARRELVKQGFIEQENLRDKHGYRVIGKRVFRIVFDFARPQQSQNPRNKSRGIHATNRAEFTQQIARNSRNSSEHLSVSNPRPERVPEKFHAVPKILYLNIDIDGPSSSSSPGPYEEIFALWNEKKGEEEEEEIFYSDLKKALASIRKRHGLGDEEAVEVFTKAVGSTLTPEIGRPIYYSQTLDGKRAIRDALKTASPTLTTAFKPDPPKAMEASEDGNDLSSSDISRPARFDSAAWIEGRMEHVRVARDALVRAGVAIPYTSVELMEMKASLEARAAGLAKGERRGAIKLDSPEGTQSGFGAGVREIIGRLRYAQAQRSNSA